MRYSKYYLVAVALIGLFSFACSDIQDEITPPLKVSVHGSNVFNPMSDTYHGLQTKNFGLESCKQCHEGNFQGGTTKVSCATSNCHPSIVIHKSTIMDPASEQFHGRYIANTLNWDMDECKSCHGASYSGGVASPTCNTCHNKPGGPEACNTCHGDFNDPSKISPPRGTNNEINTTQAAVGAHQFHLNNIKIAPGNVTCSECHTIPSFYGSPGHIDNSPGAEVKFSGIATLKNANGSYDHATLKCSNTYCHGNFEFSKATSQYPFAYEEEKMVGNNYSPLWNKVDGTEAKCGTCHGLPPKGHIASTLRSCSTCHVGVVDRNGKIIDPSKHIDGKIQVFGN
jgi:predicted CxxxxCH...CXXCH cytochrome family protein